MGEIWEALNWENFEERRIQIANQRGTESWTSLPICLLATLYDPFMVTEHAMEHALEVAVA